MFLVCGSGRSGTSAVARVLHDSGIEMGRDLIAADEANPEGYFEERGVVAMNDALLNDVGLHRWFATASRSELLAAAQARGKAMATLAAAATAGWKDPRFCWTLEAWLEVLAPPPRIIVCLRSPAEVIASTLRYYGLAGDEPERAAAHTWRVEYERLLEVIAEYRLDAVCVEYASLLSDREATLARLSAFVGCPLDAAGLRSDLRHHRAEIAAGDAELYARVAALG
jgi:hypothetical protein